MNGTPAEREGMERLATLSALIREMQQCYQLIAARIASQHGIPATLAWPLMMIGWDGGRVELEALARVLEYRPGKLTRFLNPLVELGYIAFETNKSIVLTPEGGRIVERMNDDLHRFRESLGADYPDADWEACLRVLSTLNRNIKSSPYIN